jgi:NAD(P)H-dependent flavin oxidoreductase YrpB (nitropropane dioxygenase family)
MEVVIEEAVPVYGAGLGNPAPWMERLRANGTFVMSVVGSLRHVSGALEAGVDAIVAQGSDGGGHNAPIGTMALVPRVVDLAGSTPVLAAGGIGDGRGLAADADDTQISAGVTGKPVRFLRGSWTTAWNESGREALPMPWQTVLVSPVMGAARVTERSDVNPGIAGQGVGLTLEIRPAAEVVAGIVAEAEASLGRGASHLA